MPSNRLIFWCAATLLPAALLLTLAPHLLWLAALLAAAVCAAGAIDAAQVRGTAVSFALPEVTNFSCGRPGALNVRLAFPAALQGRVVRLALDVPAEAGVADAVLDCRLPAGTEQAHIAWTCCPVRRGTLTVRHAACEVTSGLGLWHRIHRQAVRSALRVYPDLRGEQRKIAPIFVRRASAGAHACRLAGKGREFEKLREYVPGDDLGDIHWKATARRRFPITKVFQAERTQEAYIVLDVSRLSGRLLGDDAQTVLDQYIQTALTLVLAAERLGDRCGLIVFHRMVVRFLPADSGKQHFDACRNALYMLQTEAVAPDFRDLFAFLRARIPKRALMLFLTHIDTPALAEAFLDASRLVLRQHLLVVPLLTAHDAQPLFSTPPPETIDDAFRDLAAHLHWRDLNALERQLRARGVQSSLAPVRKATAVLGAHYLTVKERQLL
ncbi:MAG: DUF58 domain-containing protein [Kiritimatiellaeota bacterium]|nr:DUF58 domain-containing protein [Kiritimatiellota bacterium]